MKFMATENALSLFLLFYFFGFDFGFGFFDLPADDRLAAMACF
jgi:hypothetical protein